MNLKTDKKYTKHKGTSRFELIIFLLIIIPVYIYIMGGYIIPGSRFNIYFDLNPKILKDRKELSKYRQKFPGQSMGGGPFVSDEYGDTIEDLICDVDRYRIKNPVLYPIRRTNYTTNGVHVNHREMGYMDRDGNVVIEPRYTFTDDFYEGLARVYVGGGYFTRGIKDFGTGESFYDVFSFIEGNYGYINEYGKFVIEPQFELAGRFSEGLAFVKVDGKYGYINKQGQIVIQPQFYCAGPFEDGTASVCVEKKVIEPSPWYCVEAYFPENEIPSVCMDRSYKNRKLIDKWGRFVEPEYPEFDRVHRFSEGIAIVEKDGKMGAINKRGELVIDTKYDYLSLFNEGLAVVKIDDKYGFINKQGQIVIQPKYNHACPFSEGLASVDWGGYIEKLKRQADGKYFDTLEIRRGNKLGCIDKTGNVVFERAGWYYPFVEGKALVNSNSIKGWWIYVDKAGKEIFTAPDPDVIIKLSRDDALTYIVDVSYDSWFSPEYNAGYFIKAAKKIKQNLNPYLYLNEKISVVIPMDKDGTINKDRIFIHKSSGNDDHDKKFIDTVTKSFTRGKARKDRGLLV